MSSPTRRSLISAAFGGAAGVVVGRELAPTAAGAAADVDRAEFDALKARVAYLEGFHPPMPQHKFSGDVSLPDGFVVPFGEVWDFDPDVSTTVTVGKNVVVAGTLQMRPANPGVTHTLRFTGITETNYVGGGMVPLDSDVGLWVIGAGVLDIAGSAKTSWARTAQPIAAGATSITLAATPTGWQVGDTLAIAPMADCNVSANHNRYSTVTVQSVAGNVVGVTACQEPHPLVTVGTGFTLGAEVLNLTRNAQIEGTPTGRAHVWVNSSVPQQISDVQIRYMGPRKAGANVLGRYPLHLHMSGDGSRGSVIKGVVVRDSGGRAFVPHASHGVTFDGCVAHGIIDDAYWWDGGGVDATHDVVFSKCVASAVQFAPNWSGHRLGGFFLGEGQGNSITDCSAFGVWGGQTTAGSSGYHWPEGATASWTFARNVAHNVFGHGLTVWQNSGIIHDVHDFVCFYNGRTGLSIGAYLNRYRFRNGYLYGNAYASIDIHALSAEADHEARYESIAMDGLNYHAHAIRASRHRLVGGIVDVTGCTFARHTGAAIGHIPGTDVTTPSRIDVVGCTPAPSVFFGAGALPESMIRVQNGTSATAWTPAGSTPIATFSTATVVPPTPFAVIASA